MTAVGSGQKAEAAFEGPAHRRFRLIADLKQIFADGDDVCVVYDMVTNTPAGTAFIAEWFKVKGENIAAIRVVFDACPFAAMFAK
jgi:hypothetical protein